MHWFKPLSMQSFVTAARGNSSRRGHVVWEWSARIRIRERDEKGGGRRREGSEKEMSGSKCPLVICRLNNCHSPVS